MTLLPRLLNGVAEGAPLTCAPTSSSTGRCPTFVADRRHS